jgi:hypothetical protein
VGALVWLGAELVVDHERDEPGWDVDHERDEPGWAGGGEHVRQGLGAVIKRHPRLPARRGRAFAGGSPMGGVRLLMMRGGHSAIASSPEAGFGERTGLGLLVDDLW